MKFASICSALECMLVLAAFVSCGKPERAADSAASKKVTARPVQTATATLRAMERTIRATGTLAPQEESTLSTKVSGRIQRLEIDIGDKVNAGDLIAQVDPKDYELRVQQAAAALQEARAALGIPLDGDGESLDVEAVSSVRQAKAVLEESTRSVARVRSLTEARIASASELDTAESAYKVAVSRYSAAVDEARARIAALAQRRVEHDIARKQLADASVRAPFEGAIQARHASVGEFVATGAPIARLVKIDPLRLRLEVPERESMLVSTGQVVRLTVQGSTNLFTGRIARLSPALNETNRMLLVEADVPSQGVLRAGLFARADILIREAEERLSVPTRALSVFAGIQKVIAIREGKAVEKQVTTGRRGPDWVEILSGLNPGTAVVLDPIGLRSGQPVTVPDDTQPVRATEAGLGLPRGS
jgi:RND family efflux transporter MFP subunit